MEDVFLQHLVAVARPAAWVAVGAGAVF